MAKIYLKKVKSEYDACYGCYFEDEKCFDIKEVLKIDCGDDYIFIQVEKPEEKPNNKLTVKEKLEIYRRCINEINEIVGVKLW